MQLIDFPPELLYNVAELLDPRDHSALTLTNRQLAATLQPFLRSRMRILPLVDINYGVLAIYWAIGSRNFPSLKNLLATVPGIMVIAFPPPGSSILRSHPQATARHDTPSPCARRTWSWLKAGSISARLFNQQLGFSRAYSTAEHAIVNNHYALFRLALAASPDLEFAQTTLHFAACYGQLHTLDVGLSVFRQMYGAAEGDRELKDLLLYAVDKHGAEFLLKGDETLDSRDEAGRTLLHRVVAGLVFSDGVREVLPLPQLVTEVLKSGASLHAVDGEGGTALHVAAGFADVGLVELLLRAGAKINARDANGCVAVHRAARSDGSARWQVVELLRVFGADFGAVDNAGVVARDLMNVPVELRSARALRRRNAQK